MYIGSKDVLRSEVTWRKQRSCLVDTPYRAVSPRSSCYFCPRRKTLTLLWETGFVFGHITKDQWLFLCTGVSIWGLRCRRGLSTAEFIFLRCWDLTKCLTHTKQVLYYWDTPPSHLPSLGSVWWLSCLEQSLRLLQEHWLSMGSQLLSLHAAQEAIRQAQED
jgi:hypothetical protein